MKRLWIIRHLRYYAWRWWYTRVAPATLDGTLTFWAHEAHLDALWKGTL